MNLRIIMERLKIFNYFDILIIFMKIVCIIVVCIYIGLVGFMNI